jgi:hypothetical protein
MNLLVLKCRALIIKNKNRQMKKPVVLTTGLFPNNLKSKQTKITISRTVQNTKIKTVETISKSSFEIISQTH